MCFPFSSSRNVTHFNETRSPGRRNNSSSDRANLLYWNVSAAALLRRERKSFGFRRACGEERRKLVARPHLYARVVFLKTNVFPRRFLWFGRAGVTLGAAQTRQGRCPCTLPKGMIPFGNLFCYRLLDGSLVLRRRPGPAWRRPPSGSRRCSRPPRSCPHSRTSSPRPPHCDRCPP